MPTHSGDSWELSPIAAVRLPGRLSPAELSASPNSLALVAAAWLS